MPLTPFFNRSVRAALRAGALALLVTTVSPAGAVPVAATPASAPAANALRPAAPIAAPIAARNSLVRVSDGRLLAPDIARIVNRGELVVAMLGVDTPPFFYMKDGKLTGLEVDMAEDIGRALKVSVRFNRDAKSFNEVVEIVARGDADAGISKLSRTLARAQVVQFSDPYLSLKHALVLNRVSFAQLALDRPVPEVVRGYKGTIGVIAKSSFADFATQSFPKATLKAYPSWADVVKAVSSGEVSAAYRDEFEIKRLLKSDPAVALTLRTVTFKDMEDTLGIALDINDVALTNFINLFLAQRSEKLDIDRVLRALGN